MAKIATTQRNGQGRKILTSDKKELTLSELQQIEKLSYQFFVDRGYEHGHDQEDWLRAQAIVRNRRS